MNPSISGHVVPPGAGREVRAFGDIAYFHLTGAETGGKLTMFTDVTPPGGGPPPHYHNDEDESFVVLEGRVAFLNAGAWCEVPPGGAVFMPRGTPHTFKNVGDTPSKLLICTSPSGFETFFERCAAEFQKPAGPDMGKIVEISAEHGIHYLKP